MSKNSSQYRKSFPRFPGLAFRTRWGKLRRLKFLRPLSSPGRWLAATGAGLLLAASFPKIEFAGAAWLAPGLLLFTTLGQGGGRAFRLGYVAGLAQYLASLYWLLFIPVSIAPIFGWLALSAYLALYPALWVWLCWKIFPAAAVSELPPNQDSITDGHQSPLPAELLPLQTLNWFQRAGWLLGCAVLWVALEMILGRFLTGYPWLFLGVSQYKILPLIQVASVTGIYGVSFLVAWFSVSLACAGFALMKRSPKRPDYLADLRLPLLVIAVVVGLGMFKCTNRSAPERELKVALVQPSIPQTMIWDSKDNTNRFNQLLRLSELALATQPDLLIWPEAAVPEMLRYDEPTAAAVAKLAREHQVWMIVGSDDAEPSKDPATPKGTDYFNSSFLVSPTGQLVGKYDKRRLVIFGEYVPLIRWLPFLKYFTPITGGFTPGTQPVFFEMAAPHARVSVLICIEDAFPHQAREHVQDDTDFLVNLTNDGWFGTSAAQWQHAANAVFRAVENDVPLVRCTNNGLTCWIDRFGAMHEVYFGDSPDIYAAGFKTAKIPLLSPGEKRAPTFYNRHGDWFGWSCVGVAAVLLAWRRLAITRG